MEKRPLVVLTGPTAVGKTKLSIALAKALNGEIISADSMQVYRYMDIGSAKIKKDEMQGVQHYLVDVLDPTQDFHVVLFQQLAKEAIEQIYAKGKIPILVGGTGFYIQAVLKDIDFTENDSDISLRNELEQLAAEKGNEALHHILQEIDPESAQTIHANNVKRVIRAIEFYRQTGMKISEHNELEKQKESAYDSRYFVLNCRRENLYDRIDRRVDLMMEEGLVDEVKKLMQMGCNKNCTSMQGLGYKEIIAFLQGNCSMEEAVDTIKQETRHFAKRQLTWFRREKNVIWIEKEKFANDEEKMLQYMIDICNWK